ncbi:hypothetical protein MKW98_007331 [Papaver atlanticum]|uniref:RNA-dependent RNA polymerase n=1 Tax=Papaver atlanticum TaxID=357466 RepID=A0AAD4XCS0_9MAGN|nr:hypothetical protein MKW98_007331 [Papaver atlanticum]
MGSLGFEKDNKKDLIITQVSLGGFDQDVTAKELAQFIEKEIGITWRCRLKKSWTPPESLLNFDITNTRDLKLNDDFEKVEPHAFVHFASPDSATSIFDRAGRNQLELNGKILMVNLGPESSSLMNTRRMEIDPFTFRGVGVEIGTRVSRDKFLIGWKGPPKGADFFIDPFDGSCKINFTKETAFSFKGTSLHAVLKCDFKTEFFVRDINEVRSYMDQLSWIMELQLVSSPLLYYRTADDDIHATVPFDLLDDEDPWIRTTDFTSAKVIGRCNSYRIFVPPRQGKKLKEAIEYLKKWRIIPYDCPAPKFREEPDFGSPMPDPFFCFHPKEKISFELLFLVNAAIHKGIFSHFQLSDRFFELLRSHEREVNVAALTYIYSGKTPVFDPAERLRTVQIRLLKNPKMIKSFKGLDDSAEVRRLIITPTKAYCLPPEVELSNRILRKYREFADRFLRVTFMDEGSQQLNSNVLTYYVTPIVRDMTKNSFPQKTLVFNRVKTILKDGFYLCGRKYSFLAFSSNQLRDRSAWFFAEGANIKVSDIKSWMGKFTDKNVAKCTARMGMCFSSTFATVEVPFEQVNGNLPDIERNGYVFSDGIGKITPDLAKEVADKLQLTSNPPCAYQIRFAGCKGVVACWPEKTDEFRLSIRPSMIKFQSKHTILEIVSWTRFQPGFLNRQIIILLSALGVPDSVFSLMQATMVYKLCHILENTDIAFDVLTSSCGEQGNTAAMMLGAGFKPQTEPHLRGMLTAIRAGQFRDLLEKTRIFVPQGRWLMGCFDELGVLEQGQCFIQSSIPSLENCFSDQGPGFSGTKKGLQVIKGTVVVAKNPCLHPGDIRILEAVDNPGLHHLVDCLVFPQKGDRPHANEASGSDLDGDLYFVTWDENLIPPSKRSWIPMDYSPGETQKLQRAVNQSDIVDFFVKNMVNEKLGTICNSHVVHADLSDYGAMDEKCIKLAELAATAVDFPKTGKVVAMPQELKPKMYPDFMGKEDFISYKSKKVLGELYRKIKDSPDLIVGDSDKDTLAVFQVDDIPYDTDLEIPGSADFIREAWDRKCLYDGQLNALLEQFNVKSEEEVVTGHVWSMPKYNNRKLSELKEKLKLAYNSVRREFKRVFVNLGEDSQNLTEGEKNTIYEQKASAWYQVTYHPRWVKKLVELRNSDDKVATPMLSFAWVPAEYLVRIKIRCRDVKHLDMEKPINSLAGYLVGKI